MRGTQDHGGGCEHGSGIIPAYAGNTLVCGCECYVSWDHPRVCGEHVSSNSQALSNTGSSPRMRGTLGTHYLEQRGFGIIPAYAGNTIIVVQRFVYVGDHPRVCGEHFQHYYVPLEPEGSSPRMRGTPVTDYQGATYHGIIPAYAGNTLSLMGVDCRLRDHPRVCGEHSVHEMGYWSRRGSSPRMRGTLHYLALMFLHRPDHPRVCGEHTS